MPRGHFTTIWVQFLTLVVNPLYCEIALELTKLRITKEDLVISNGLQGSFVPV